MSMRWFFFQTSSPLCHLHPLLRPPLHLSSYSCRFLKPCGTRPVCPSQEVWGRMAASWRQTAPKPCMLATPPSDTLALQWSPPDCPENQKHLPCLNDTQTYRLRKGHTYTHMCIHTITDTTSHITHTLIKLQKLKYKYSDTETQNTHFYTLEYMNTQRIIISLSCCHWLILQETSEIQLWSEQQRKKKTKDNYDYHTCLQHSFFFFFLGRYNPDIYKLTGKPAQTYMKWNMSCEPDHQTDHDDDSDKDDDHSCRYKKTKTTKQLCSCSVFIG